MAKKSDKWYNSDFGQLAGLGILVFLGAAGIGKLVQGINTNSPRQTKTIKYEMDGYYKQIEEKRLDIIDKHLESYKDSLPAEDFIKIMRELKEFP